MSEYKPMIGTLLILLLFLAAIIWMFIDVKRDDGLLAAFKFIGLLLAILVIIIVGAGLMSGAI